MPPIVLWIRVAEERLAAALRQTTERTGNPEAERADISARLAAAFPAARHVIVLDYFVGFKHRPGEHILQVEVRDGNNADPLVVKLAAADRLQREKNAWEYAKTVHGNNPVFMPMRACPDGAADDRLVAIAYQHAQKHIGAERTAWLETAVRNCVRFHSVTLESVIAALHDIYAQAGRLYRDAGLQPAGDKCLKIVPTRLPEGGRHPLALTLERWDQPEPRAIRQQVNAAFAVGSMAFLDPVDACRYYDEQFQKPTPPAALLPLLLRGLAHGDLHGRNSIVGIDDEDRVNFPTLFDYESIHPDNLIGWDFVEMEIELKIRIFERIFPHTRLSAFARQVQEFEAELNSRTRQCHDSRIWPEGQADASTPRDRLLAVLLAIRQEAFAVLGRPRAQSLDWLREYLFLVACYGLTTVRYDNQSEFQRAAAYVSAGAAIARLEGMRGPVAAPPLTDVQALLAARFASYQIPLSAAREWDRQGDHASAERLLAELVSRYPAALHVRFEQAFNMVKQKRGAEAMQKLQTLHDDFAGALDENTWSLWGRCHKDLGDANFVAGLKASKEPQRRGQFEEADEHYREALAKYETAYGLVGGFFSGINVATLRFLLAALCHALGRSAESKDYRAGSQQLAGRLLETRPQWKSLEPDDPVWMRATEAEANVLLKRWEHAGEKYRAAVVRGECAKYHPQSMGRQLARILQGFGLLGEPVSLASFGDLGPIKDRVTLE